MAKQTINRVDIAICTWNRAALLQRTLDSISRLAVPENVGLTLLIVNNHSTDNTAETIAAFVQSPFAKRHAVVSLFEPRQGHTFSRNLAIEHAQGDLVIWTDDDVCVAEDWLQRYVEAAEQQPEISFWGSVIEPEFEHPPGAWIIDNWDRLKGCFAHRDFGGDRIPLTPDRLPYGANFAIRGAAQRLFQFATELGRQGELVLGEDELDLMRRMLAAGHQGNWVPGAVARHLIPDTRATVAYVHAYFVGQGRSLVARGIPWHSDPARHRRESRLEYARFLMKRWWADSRVWCSHLLRSGLAQGQYEALVVQQRGS